MGMVFSLAAGCGGAEQKDDGVAAEKKALEEAAVQLKQPVALISAYLPHLRPAEEGDRFAAKRRPEDERVAACASNEVRHAANGARQKLRGDSQVTRDLTAALTAIATDCADAQDPAATAKCVATVDRLEAALTKSEAVPGASVKLPRVGPEAITDEANKAIAAFLKAKGPGPAGKAYLAKRPDAGVSVADLLTACQAAADEASDGAAAFEKAAEPIRLIAVTRKMSMDSQCGALNAMDALQKDLEGCRKKAKTTDCKIVCGKAKAKVEDGVPAAAFLPLEKAVADICEK